MRAAGRPLPLTAALFLFELANDLFVRARETQNKSVRRVAYEYMKRGAAAGCGA